MSRKTLIRCNELPYHVTNQVNNREHYPMDLTSVWDLFQQVLYESCLIHGGKVHALVLMSNHYHLLMTCPESDIATVMADFGTEFTKRLNKATGRCGHLFRGRYNWSLIHSPEYAAAAVRYVYRNPIRAGLVDGPNVLDYRFSTLPMKMGLVPMGLKLHPIDSYLLPELPADLAEWVAIPTGKEEDELMRMGLRRARFEPGMDRHSARRRTLGQEWFTSPGSAGA